MTDTVTLTRVQPPAEYEVKGDGRIFVITPPAELQDADGNVVGYEGKKHRRPIEPEADVKDEPAEVKSLATLARSPERLARAVKPEPEPEPAEPEPKPAEPEPAEAPGAARG